MPAVLRDEPQYRLLFGSQVLSILGDRVTQIALPFAVLSIGGGVKDVALVSTAQFLPFVLLAVPAGVWADRLDRKRILIASDARPPGHPGARRHAAPHGRGRRCHLVVLAAVFGAADAFFAPAFSGLLPTTVSPANVQPANALRGLTFSLGNVDRARDRRRADRLRRRPRRGAGLRRGDVRRVARAAAAAATARWSSRRWRRRTRAATTSHFWTSLREGWGRWSVAAGWSASWSA